MEISKSTILTSYVFPLHLMVFEKKTTTKKGFEKSLSGAGFFKMSE